MGQPASRPATQASKGRAIPVFFEAAAMSNDLSSRTIRDFSEQWGRHTANDGYYGSTDLFLDIAGPLLSADDVRGRRVADIGSGTGRIAGMLLGLGAEHVVCVEPASGAFLSLLANTRDQADRITYVNAPGEALPAAPAVDLVVSIGVIHHIPEPDPVLLATYAALKPGGKCLFWLYGAEGNRVYLAIVRPVRAVTSRLPHHVLDLVCGGLNLGLSMYVAICKAIPERLPLPLKAYILRVLAPLTRQQRKLVIYDQLNPAYAKYYTRQEAVDLLQRAGFENCRAFHRHRYSWTVIGTRPQHATTGAAA